MSKITISQIPTYLSQLEQEIRKPGILSQEKYEQFHQQLDAALASLAKGTEQMATPLKDRIVALCGELEDRLEQTHLQAIQDTTRRLASLVQRYEQDHRPSLADKKVLDQAHRLLSLSPSPKKEKVEARDIDPEEVFTLLEMARAIYNKQISQARKLYLTLPEPLKLEFVNHMNHLMATPFDHTTETLQALMLMSGALAPTSSLNYPSSHQIDLFFLGIPQEETTQPKIIPFDANLKSGHAG